MTGPLAGVTVLELGGKGPVPFAGMLLADLGATVIRVDPPAIETAVARPFDRDVQHRGKQSAVLDLKQPQGRDAVRAIASRCDVFVEGFRPGVTERMGLGPDELLAANPKLVYARMTGWGQTGPAGHTAGHDINYIALAGVLHGIGSADGPPQVPGNFIGDYGAGSLYLVIGILAALREAAVTGAGQVVDAAIVDGASHLLANYHGLLNAGAMRDTRGVNLLDGGAPFYTTYRTADGEYVAVGAIEPKFFATLVGLLGVDIDPARQYDEQYWPTIRDALTTVFAGRTRAEWEQLCAGTDACVTPVLALRETPSHPHLAARGSVTAHDGALQPGRAPRFSAHPDQPLPAPPRLGEHTAAVLSAYTATRA